MKRWLGVVLIAAHGAAHAATFFEPCESALQTLPFKALQAFYAGKPGLARPQSCFRLNDRAFLVTLPDLARRVAGLYAFDAGTGSYGLANARSSPNLRVRFEFDGPNHKHFALLESSDMHRGDHASSYEVLFLTPKSDGQVFARQLLVETHAGGDGPCPPEATTASSLEGLRAESENTGAVQLVFDITTTRCTDGQAGRVQKRFGWNGQRFVAL
ncbi:hypothetical protein [Roseateles sp.]|uniref:hypothetical protein n=1 Tax=Roseateles sp. TaxID=1971397 RepID=UPI0039EC30D6